LDELLKKIWEETEPVSIFLYGSMVRDDFENDSDYEVGIIYERDKKMSRQKLSEFYNYKNVKIYPFILEELENGEINTPFPKAIYLQTLLQEDLLESVVFCLGRAYSAVVSSRQNDWVTVRDNFTKSAFYGLQILVFIKTGELIFSYKKIQEKSKDLLPEEYKELIDHVIEVRKGNVVVNTSLLYKNISFLNKVVLKAINID